MTTAECHHRFDSFDTGLISDYPAVSAFQWYQAFERFNRLGMGVAFPLLSGFGNILNGRDYEQNNRDDFHPRPSHPG
jgi:hypothetical protein